MPPSTFDYERFLKTVTAKPGVYQMLDAGGAVLYVGKAKNLKNRLGSYFRGGPLNGKTMAMVGRIGSVQVTVTNTESEALLLEQNLIKQYRPPYNILLRDDKSYPYIYLSTDQAYPQLSFHRGAKKGKGRYFGPYPSAGAVRESLNFLQKVFKVRQCDDSFFRNRSRPCLQFQINRCTAPCVDAISPEDYAQDVRFTEMFLSGQSAEVVSELANAMDAAASTLDFERAAILRDRIQQLQQVQARQYIEGETGNLDIAVCAIHASIACVQLLYVRDGRILGSRSYFPTLHLDEAEADVLDQFIAQHYLSGLGAHDIPAEILINAELDDQPALEEAIAIARGRKVQITQRVRGNRAKWLELAITTAQQNLATRIANKQTQSQRFEALQEALGLDEVPQRLECFDISHSSGEAAVASCVVFDGSGPLKSDYRKFNIEGITPGDDYAAMQQALSRRYARLKRGEGKMPDILFIDGGKGQVTQAMIVLEELQIDEVLVIGVAKGADRKPGLETLIRPHPRQGAMVDGIRTDEVKAEELSLPRDSAALHLIQHIRDEAHRFAVAGHTARRDKKRRESTLESIPGVGPKRRRELLRQFGGLQGINAASLEDLCRVPGISSKLAEDIFAALHGD